MNWRQANIMYTSERVGKVLGIKLKVVGAFEVVFLNAKERSIFKWPSRFRKLIRKNNSTI